MTTIKTPPIRDKNKSSKAWTRWYQSVEKSVAGSPDAVVSEITFGLSPAQGSSANYARQDHTHGSPPLSLITGDTVVAETSFGESSTPGVAETFSRSDHTHGTPTAPAGSNEFGSYTGDGAASKTITLSGASTPKGVWVQGVGGAGRRPRWRTASMGAGNCLDPSTSSNYVTDGITAFGAGSFTVGNGSEVNNSGDTYHYWVVY